MPSKPSDKAIRALELARQGVATAVIAQRVGMSRSGIEKIRQREGLTERRIPA